MCVDAIRYVPVLSDVTIVYHDSPVSELKMVYSCKWHQSVSSYLSSCFLISFHVLSRPNWCQIRVTCVTFKKWVEIQRTAPHFDALFSLIHFFNNSTLFTRDLDSSSMQGGVFIVMATTWAYIVDLVVMNLKRKSKIYIKYSK